MSDTMVMILASAAVAYGARVTGYLILSRFERIHFRVAAALDAVPAAVMTTLVVPAAINGGWREILVIAAAVLAAIRFGTMATVIFSMVAILALRAV
ncbi:branched-chain amino acid transport [Acuticoccus sediminis]|uniref:Branched-chain amino acid transport n=1 Tax=Acuticoccus sediminis TaxID=2184697 RepID=A0A8B2P4C5_9HYPH|nr:AzlD domain-containing protein [Acuticoccus sediminis]RAI03972.1 branched-chain amino acid transport [Acuticoccus sediminis]